MENLYQIPEDMRKLYESFPFPFAIVQVVEGSGYVTLLVSDGLCALFGEKRAQLATYLTGKGYSRTHPDDAGNLMHAASQFTKVPEQSVICRMIVGGSYHPILFHEKEHIMPDGTPLYFVEYSDLDAERVSSSRSYSDYVENQQEYYLKDYTTGIPNINYFQQFSKGRLRSLLQAGITPAVIFFDIEGMHSYNDRYGYTEGDRLLKTLAGILKSVFQNQMVARYTEDHFLVITDADSAEMNAAEVRARFREAITDDITEIKAGIYACKDPEEEPVKAVDKARLARDFIQNDKSVFAKNYNITVQTYFQKRDHVLGHFQEAMEKGWIRPYYQPVMGILSKKIYTFEALARWDEPGFGFLSPADFIGTLEEAHLTWELDLYLLEQACKELAERRREGKPWALVSVNLSRHDLEVPAIHDLINKTLDTYEIGHEWISLEITESALVDHEEFIQDHIEKFHADGYRVWLDDFGSGYSSYNALQRFDFDLLKIDMMFLRHTNERTKPILSSIVGMAKKLGITTLTEGVETGEQLEFLSKIGCSLIQGYYLSKPLPADQLLEVMQKKGIGFEIEEEHSYYQELAKVNVLDVESPFVGEAVPQSEYERYIGIMEQSDAPRFIYLNDAFRNRADHFTETSPDTDPFADGKLTKEIVRCLEKEISYLKKPRDIVETTFRESYFTGKVKIQLIAALPDRRAYLIVAVPMKDIELAAYGDEQKYIAAHYRSAMEKGQIRLCFRQYVGQLSGKIAMVESYPYWNDPEKGEIDQNLFLGVLENSDLIHEFDLLTIERVTADMRHWMDLGHPCMPTMIGISAGSFRNEHFRQEVNSILASHDIPHQMLVLRFRDHDLSKYPAESRQALKAFHADGYQTAVYMRNDTGGSTMRVFMTDIPFDYAKLTLSDDMLKSSRVRAILKSITGAALEIGISPVIEGVLDEESVRFLKSAGCFLIEEPVSGPGLYYSDEDAEIYHRTDKFETPDEYDFYREISKVNVLAYQRSVPGDGLQYSISMAMFTVRDGKITTIYLSENTREWFKEVHVPEGEGSSWLEAHGNDESNAGLWEAMGKLKEPGDSTLYYYYIDGRRWTVWLKLLAVSGDTRAYMADTAVVGEAK